MTLFHEESRSIGIPPEIYGKHVTPTNEDIVGNSTVFLQPISADINASVLSFVYNGSPLYHTDLSRTLMRLECQIVDQKNQTIPAPREVVPAPSVLSSIFSSRKVTINNATIKTGEFLPYLGFIRDAFSLRMPYKQSVALGTNFYYDGVINSKQIAKEFARSSTKKFQVVGGLDLPPFNNSKVLPPSIQMRFDFYRSSDEFFLMDWNRYNPELVAEIEKKTGKKIDQTTKLDPLHAKVKILSAQLEILCLELSPRLNAQLEQRLKTSNLVMEMTRPEFNSFVINQGTMTIHTPAMSTGTVPNRILIFLVQQDRYVGEYTESPFTFHHHNLSKITLMKNGHSMDKEYQVDFDSNPDDVNGNAIYAYLKLHSFLGQDTKESCGITLHQYINSLCCFPFDLTPGLTGFDQSATSLITEGDISVRLDFNKAPDKNLILLYYCEYKSTMEIDTHRHVYINY